MFFFVPEPLAEGVARQLLREDARVSLGELAALQKVRVLEARARHERVRAHLLLQPVAQLHARLHRADLCHRDGARRGEFWHLVGDERGAQPRLAFVHEGFHSREAFFGFVVQRPELRDVAQRRGGASHGAHLRVAVFLRVREQRAREDERRLRHGDAAGEESLADHLHRLLRGAEVRARRRVDAAVSVQQTRVGNAEVAEPHPRVVKVQPGGLQAHVPDRHASSQGRTSFFIRATRVSKPHEEPVRPDAFAVGSRQVGDHHRPLRGQTLRDPVLARALVFRVEDERFCVRIVRRGRVHDEPGVDPRQTLGEAKAPELAGGLDGIQKPQVFGAPERDHRPGEKVELHGEPDPEPGAVRGGVRGQKPVRQEEPAGIVADVGEPKRRAPNDLPKEIRGLRVRHASRAETRDLAREPARPGRAQVVARALRGGRTARFLWVVGDPRPGHHPVVRFRAFRGLA
mmetsp:Transcript_5949/g.24117  ORF Transcript_5949/g.24117 Transcript_5949/m.24117 type:complete len:459 (+) Transcript_5949:513-1889(+)